MILASAQTKPIRGDYDSNLRNHYRLIEKASENGTNLIAFPEMSITGYERENADLLTFSRNDSRIEKLLKLAIKNNIIIIAGAPILINSDMYIGEYIIQPDNSVSIYTKQFLHPGEDVYFKSTFDNNPIIKFENEIISLAICADIDHPEHPQCAAKLKSTIYIPSIFFSPNGISSAHEALCGYAKKHSMNILMSNFGGDSWGQPSGGRSAFWNKEGKLIIEMKDSDSGLIVVENNNDTWTGRIIKDLEKK